MKVAGSPSCPSTMRVCGWKPSSRRSASTKLPCPRCSATCPAAEVADQDRTLRWPDGSIYRITGASDETDDQRLEMELDVPAGAWSPAAHVHEQLTEEFEVLNGWFEVLRDDRWQRLEKGDAVSILPGTVHTFRFGSSPARVRNIHRPALDFEPYVRELCEIANRHGLRDPSRLRGSLAIATLLRKYPLHSRAPSPLLEFATGPASVVARALGLASPKRQGGE